jgi:hypothetical protein
MAEILSKQLRQQLGRNQPRDDDDADLTYGATDPADIVMAGKKKRSRQDGNHKPARVAKPLTRDERRASKSQDRKFRKLEVRPLPRLHTHPHAEWYLLFECKHYRCTRL